MMQRIGWIFAAMAAMVLIGAGLFSFFSGREETFFPAPGKAWIEVTSPKVFEVGADGSTLTELRTGDEIKEGATLRSDVSGRATVHLSDGSELRLDVNSTVVLEVVRVERDETLTMRATLVAGRVWSKVVGFATARPRWEVKTSNAAVTVRGTAFLVEYKNGKSRVLTSENSVTVRPVDPETKFPVASDIPVTEGFLVEFDDSTARTAAAVAAPKELLSEKWMKDNQSLDGAIEQKIRIIEEETGDDTEKRRELRAEVKRLKEKVETLRRENNSEPEIIKEIRDEDIEELRARVKARVLDETSENKSVPEISIPVEGKKSETETLRTGTSGGGIAPSAETQVAPEAKITSLVIETKAIARVFTTGDRVVFRAVLVYADGTRRDVTDKASWKLSGNIGAFDAAGSFIAKVRDEDSELGAMPGSIMAEITVDGALWSAKPVDFTVMPAIEETIPIG